MTRVAVIGAGAMGSGIAQACAAAGHAVRLHDARDDAVTQALAMLTADLEKRVAAGKAHQDDVDALRDRIAPGNTLEEAVRDADLVIEAVFEDLRVKQDLFERLGRIAGPETLLATNTSSLRVQDLAAVTEGPERVLGLHFFFPAQVNRLVEVVEAPETAPEAAQQAAAWMEAAGKVPIRTADAHGFCVNRFLLGLGAEAFRILDEGSADAVTVETAAKQLLQAPFGPVGVYNLSGPVVTTHALETLHQAFGRFYAPTAAVREHAERNEGFDLDGDPDPEAFEEVAARLRGAVVGVACHLVEEGVATEEAVETGATVALRWEQGPFAMLDEAPEAVQAEVEALHAHWGDAFPLPRRFA